MSVQTEVADFASGKTYSYPLADVLAYVQLTIPGATEQQVRDVCNADLRKLGGDWFCTGKQLPSPTNYALKEAFSDFYADPSEANEATLVSLAATYQAENP